MSTLFQHKGALLILIWSLMCFSVFLYPGYAVHSYFVYYFTTCAVTLPIAGWLADVYLGRYKVIRYSLWLMLVTITAYHALLVSEMYLNTVAAEVLEILTGCVLAIGLSGVAANTLQFGLDQLTYASSSDLSSYIGLYIWTFFLACLVISLAHSCGCLTYDSKITFFILPLLCTISVASDFLWNHWLVKEPMTNNPIKLIYQVLRHAVKNKHPRLWSAFTYWEDKPYSRIDLGKAKYGGPFTTEQVEDVKTFFRLLALVVTSSVIVGMIVLLGQSINNLMFHFQDEDYISYCEFSTVSKFMKNCYSRYIVEYFGTIVAVLLVPMLQVASHSQLLRSVCINNISVRNKILLGLLLLLLYVVLLLVVEVTGVTLTKNHNFTCLLNSEQNDLQNGRVLSLSNKWLLLPQSVSGLAIYALFKGAIEFVFAQSPNSMRGLLFGGLYYSGFVFSFVGKLALQWVAELAHRRSFKYCGIWYYLALMASIMLFTGTFVLLKKFYKLRQRDEVLPNEQIFAVNFYSKYLS